MKTLTALFAAILAVGCAHGGGPNAGASATGQAGGDEAALAAALDGRVAGPAQDCVDEVDLGGTRSYGRDVLVFKSVVRDTVYVSRPPGGCAELTSGRALKTRSTTDRLCRGDIITVFDPGSGMEYGSCGLGEFTPYTSTK